MRLLRHPAQQVVASSLLVQATTVVTGPLSVRLLGLEERGEVAVVFAVALLVGQALPWGLPQAFGYSIASGDADPKSLLAAHGGRYLRLCLLAGLVAATAIGVVTAIRPVHQPGAQVFVAFVGAAATTVAVMVISCLQGAGSFSALAVLQLVPGVVYTSSLCVLLLVGHASVGVVLALYFSGWVLLGVLGTLRLMRPVRRRGAPPMATLRAYGRRVAVAAAAPIDNLGIDQIGVGLLLGAHALGTYVVALAFKTPAALVLIAIAGVCMTHVAAIDDVAALRAYCRKWMGVSAVLGTLAVVGVELLITPVLVPAFGEGAAAAGTPAHLLVLAALPLGWRRVLAGMLQGIGHPRDATQAEALGLMTMLVGMAILCPIHGVEGAIAAVGAAGTVTAAINWRCLIVRLRQRELAG